MISVITFQLVKMKDDRPIRYFSIKLFFSFFLVLASMSVDICDTSSPDTYSPSYGYIYSENYPDTYRHDQLCTHTLHLDDPDNTALYIEAYDMIMYTDNTDACNPQNSHHVGINATNKQGVSRFCVKCMAI